jgi:carboxyl-terminal processing protease
VFILNEEKKEEKRGGGRKINISLFWLIITILTAIIASALVTALSLEAGSERAVNVGTDTRSEFAKLYSVYDTITSDFYEDVDRDELIESAIDGLVKGLDDPYSEYMDADETGEFQESVTGDFEGIGAEVMQEGNSIVVTSPMKGSPAEDAGIEPGDEIVAVDGESVEGMTANEAVQLIRGEKGSEVELSIVKGSNDPVDITVTRDTIHVDSVTYEEVDNVGYVSVNRFQEGTSEEFEEALNTAHDNENDDIIIDFRYNPGGLLNEAVLMINQFVDQGEVALSLEDSNGEQTELLTEEDKNPNTEDFDDIYILINEGSASASEVFTGAMMDHFDDVVIAGTQSFGKGVVQQTNDFSDNSMLKYTNTKWLTPDGNWIHDTGITPDIELVNPDYYRVEILNEDDIYSEDQENESVLSIKVALDALGYEVGDINETFDGTLTEAVETFQEDNDLDETGEVTGDTTLALMSELREYIRDNDAQVDYLTDYINGEYSEPEIEALAEDNAQYIDIEPLEVDQNADEEDASEEDDTSSEETEEDSE